MISENILEVCMGGYGSGRRGSKDTVGEMLALDIRRWKREDTFVRDSQANGYGAGRGRLMQTSTTRSRTALCC